MTSTFEWKAPPDDALLEILQWLPADALARCSQVNKHWKRYQLRSVTDCSYACISVIDTEPVLWQRHARHQQLESHWLPSAVYTQPAFFERLPKHLETVVGVMLFAVVLVAALLVTGPLSVLLGMFIVWLNGKTPMLFSLDTIRNRGLQLTLISTLATVSVGASLGFILKSIAHNGCDSIWMDIVLSCLLQFSLTSRMLRLYSKVIYAVRSVAPSLSMPEWAKVLGFVATRLLEVAWTRATRKLTVGARRGLRILLAAFVCSTVLVSAWWTMSLLILAAIAIVAHSSAAYILSEGCATHEDMCSAGLMLIVGRVTLRGVLAMVFGYSVIPGLGFAFGGTIALALLNAFFLRVPKMETDAMTGLLIMCVMYPVLAPSLLVLLVLRLCFGSVIGSSVTLFSFRCDGASRTVLQEPVVRLPPRRSYPSVIRGPCPQRLFTVSRAKYSAGSAAHGGCHHSHAHDTHAAAVPAVVQAAWWDTTRLREVVGRVTRIERNWYQGRCRMSEVPVSALCRLSAMSGDYVLSSAFMLDLHSGCFLRCYVQMLAGFSFHVLHGRQLIVGHGDQVKVFAVPSLAPIRRKQLPEEFGNTVCAVVDDESILVAQADGACLVDLQTFEITGTVPVAGAVKVALDELYVAVATARAVHIYSRATLNHFCDIPVSACVVLLSGGRCFVRHQFDLRVYSAETGVLLQHISFADAAVKPTAFNASVVISGAVVALAQGSAVHVHCLQTLQQLYRLEFDCYYIESLAASATRLAVMARNHPEVKWSGALQKPTYSLILLDFLNAS